MKQLYDVLWAEVSKWLNDSLIKSLLKWTKTKVSMVGDAERWFATARTATKPENMQGFHEDHMLIVVDEASGVSDQIMEAILGTLTGYDNKLLMCGNPNNIEGVFIRFRATTANEPVKKIFRCLLISMGKIVM
jgi:hypothetical protein